MVSIVGLPRPRHIALPSSADCPAARGARSAVAEASVLAKHPGPGDDDASFPELQ